MAKFYCLLGSFFAQASRFRRDENGAMAMTMGLMAIPLIFSVGAGIDYGSANMVKSKLDAIADTEELLAPTLNPGPDFNVRPCSL